MRAMWVFVALVFASGCAQKDWIDRTLVTVDVTGTWYGTMATTSGQPSTHQEVRFELEQKGPKVTGLFRGGLFVSGGTTPIEGSMTGDVFKFRDARNLLVGELTVGGDEVTGQGTVGQNRQVAFTLRRVERAATPPR